MGCKKMVDISNIKNIAVIGAGVQGHAIAQIALMGGYEKVIINSRSMNSIERAVNQIINSKSVGLKACESKGLIREGSSEILMERLFKEPDLEKAVADADYVIEAVPEILKIKQEIFEKLGKYTPEHTILATDTSMMSISKIGEASGRPENVIGMHFFSPIGSKLVEITRGNKSSDEAMDIGVVVAQKLPCLTGERLVVRLEKESPGFIANRVIGTGEIYFKWVVGEARKRGISYEQIDADIIDLMPMGACLMCDIMGLDTVYNGMKYLSEYLSPDFAPSGVFKELVDQGNFGKKTGKGFYDWSKGKPKIDRSKKAGLMKIEMLLAVHLNEGCKLLEEGIAKGYQIIDDAVYAGFRIPGPFLTRLGRLKRFIFFSVLKRYKKLSKMLGEFATKEGIDFLKPCNFMKSGKFLKMRK